MLHIRVVTPVSCMCTVHALAHLMRIVFLISLQLSAAPGLLPELVGHTCSHPKVVCAL